MINENCDKIDQEFSSTISKVINDNLRIAKEEIFKKTMEEVNKMLENLEEEKNNKNNKNDKKFRNYVIHSCVACDGCGVNPIIGNRYQCSVCENIDYCEECEEKFADSHKHPFVKLRNPRNIKIICELESESI